MSARNAVASFVAALLLTLCIVEVVEYLTGSLVTDIKALFSIAVSRLSEPISGLLAGNFDAYVLSLLVILISIGLIAGGLSRSAAAGFGMVFIAELLVLLLSEILSKGTVTVDVFTANTNFLIASLLMGVFGAIAGALTAVPAAPKPPVEVKPPAPTPSEIVEEVTQIVAPRKRPKPEEETLLEEIERL